MRDDPKLHPIKTRIARAPGKAKSIARFVYIDIRYIIIYIYISKWKLAKSFPITFQVFVKDLLLGFCVGAGWLYPRAPRDTSGSIIFSRLPWSDDRWAVIKISWDYSPRNEGMSTEKGPVSKGKNTLRSIFREELLYSFSGKMWASVFQRL